MGGTDLGCDTGLLKDGYLLWRQGPYDDWYDLRFFALSSMSTNAASSVLLIIFLRLMGWKPCVKLMNRRAASRRMGNVSFNEAAVDDFDLFCSTIKDEIMDEQSQGPLADGSVDAFKTRLASLHYTVFEIIGITICIGSGLGNPNT